MTLTQRLEQYITKGKGMLKVEDKKLSKHTVYVGNDIHGVYYYFVGKGASVRFNRKLKVSDAFSISDKVKREMVAWEKSTDGNGDLV